METITADKIYNDIRFVIDNVDKIYKETHNPVQYMVYKLGQKTSRFFKFMNSSQVKVITLMTFWAFFVTSWILSSFTMSTVSAFIIFGTMIALYTNATMEAVSVMIKTTMMNYYSGIFANAAK